MKIILIHPPIADFYDTDVRLMPLGLAYLKGALARHHPDVICEIKDYHAGYGRHGVTLPRELSLLRPYYQHADQSPFCTFYQYSHYGARISQIIDDLALSGAQAIGISALFAPYFHIVAELATAIKKALPSIPVIVGGSYASSCPNIVSAHPDIDCTVIGEGEHAIVELISKLKQGRPLPRIFKKENFTIDDIPLPDFADFPLHRYQVDGLPMTFMLTSRGCPHHCSFCTVHDTFGAGGYRLRSLASLQEEITLRLRQGYKVIDFEDDNLTFKIASFKNLLQWIIEIFGEEKLDLRAMNGISYLSLNKELLQLMKRAGFRSLNLSLVSSDDSVRTSLTRPHTLDKFKEIVLASHALQFKTVCYIILGLPNTTIESEIASLKFLADLPVLIGPSPYYSPPRPHNGPHLNARLTALGGEATETRRRQTYTLFIITRMLNFVRGLPSSPAQYTKRDHLGIAQLRSLYHGHGKLHFVNKKGEFINEMFQTELWEEFRSYFAPIVLANDSTAECASAPPTKF